MIPNTFKEAQTGRCEVCGKPASKLWPVAIGNFVYRLCDEHRTGMMLGKSICRMIDDYQASSACSLPEGEQ